MSRRILMQKKLTAGLIACAPLVGCTLTLDFDGQKAQVKAVSFRGEDALQGGSGIGSTLVVGDVDFNTSGQINDVLVGQALDFGALATIPVLPVAADPDDRTTHFQLKEAQSSSGSEEDRSFRQYGVSALVQNLGGGVGHEGPELIVGAPGVDASTDGNVIVFDGDTRAFSFGVVVGRLSGDAAEPDFGRSVALGDLDGATIGGNPDEFQTIAVGAPVASGAGSVYLFRTFLNAQSEVAFCDDGTPAALKIDAAAVAAALPASTAIGPSFGAQAAVGELGSLLGALDDRAELVVVEPDASRLFVFSFLPSATECEPMQIDPAGSLEILLPDTPASIALLDAGTNNSRIAVGFPGALGGVGEIQVCTTDIGTIPPTPSCAAISNPAPTYERLGAFTLSGYGQTLIAGDLNDDNDDGSFDLNDPDDLLVGAPTSTVGGVSGAGASFMVFADGAGGFSVGADQIQALADLAPEENAASGTALAIIGDLSGDGICEVAVGVPGANEGKGEALLYLDVTAPGFVPPP